MKKLISLGIGVAAAAAVIYPLWMRFQTLDWSSNSLYLQNIFPLFGLLAFTLLWLHAMAGVFEPWLKEYIPFDAFVHYTAILILISLILHPLLLFTDFQFDLPALFQAYDPLYLWIGIIGWTLLITYDIGKALKKYDFFVKNWRNILTISTIGFLLIFFHSLGIGSDLQEDPLRTVWIFYGTTAILATAYTYGIKRFLLKR